MQAAGPTSLTGITIYGWTLWPLTSQTAALMLPLAACWPGVDICGWLALQGSQSQACPPGPGCDNRLDEDCGLSVSVGQAEYCLNRNSCAALYPDVANRMCVRKCVRACVCVYSGWGALCQGAGLVGPCGWAVTVPAQAWSWLLSSFPGVQGRCKVCFFTLFARSKINMQ